MEAALGWKWKAVVHPDDLENLMETWRRHLVSGEPGASESPADAENGAVNVMYSWMGSAMSAKPS